MQYSKEDIDNFKKVNIALGLIAVLIIVFWSYKIGGILLAIALISYFAPFKADK